MKKQFFDLKLFCEGFKQLWLTGIVLLITALAFTGLPAIYTVLNYMQGIYNEFSFGSEQYTINAAPLLMPLIFIIPIILCFVLFSFLHNPHKSDYYHALPNSRVSIFLSFATSVLAWVYIIIITSILLTCLIFSLLKGYISPLYIPQLIFTYIAGATLVTASVLLAMNVMNGDFKPYGDNACAFSAKVNPLFL